MKPNLAGACLDTMESEQDDDDDDDDDDDE